MMLGVFSSSDAALVLLLGYLRSLLAMVLVFHPHWAACHFSDCFSLERKWAALNSSLIHSPRTLVLNAGVFHLDSTQWDHLPVWFFSKRKWEGLQWEGSSDR